MRALVLIALACLDIEGMRRTIRKQLRPVRVCYGRVGDGRHGRLVVGATIGARGTITSAEIVSSELEAAKLEACVLDAVKAWRFPAPPPGTGDITIRYPFRF